MQSKDIIAILKDYTEAPKGHSQVLSDRELSIVFDYLTLHHQVNKEVRNLWNHAQYVTFKWLNRRSQRRSFKLERFYEIWNDLIVHPYIHVDIWSGDKVIYNKNV